MDRISQEKRSQIMKAIKGKDTKPEIAIRKMVHAMGYRYSLHKKELPGTPDMYFRKYNAVIFVHGCFWHLHEGCKHGHIPKSNKAYWEKKLLRNYERDTMNIEKLKSMGIKVLVIWECEIDLKDESKMETLREKIKQHLT